MLRGFTKFMMRRNMMVMAVGIIIGATFGKIVCLLLSDMIMPPIRLLTGKADFSNLFVDLRQGKPPLPYPTLTVAQKSGAVTFDYGLFINTTIGFVIIGFSVFILIRWVNLLTTLVPRKKEVPAAPINKVWPSFLPVITWVPPDVHSSPRSSPEKAMLHHPGPREKWGEAGDGQKQFRFLPPAFVLGLLAMLLLPPSVQPVFATPPVSKSQDLLTLKNGDTLKGKLDSGDAKTITFVSEGAGKLVISWTYVRSLRVPEPFAVLTKNIRVRQGHPNRQVPEGSLDVEGQTLTVGTSSGPVRMPVAAVTHLVESKTYEKMVNGAEHFWQGWNGSLSGGASLVEATQSLETFNFGTAFTRTIPTVSWLEPDDRSILGFTSTYGTISQPNSPSISTSIFHGNAEQDQYFSRDFYALVQALYDHNSTTGLNLQQNYGAGVGYTALRRPSQELSFTLTASYIDQQFQVASADQNLVGATFTVTYFYKFPHDITFNENSYITPAFNNSSAWFAYLSAGVTIPVIDSLAFSIQAIDNYWNAPAPGFVNNSFQLNTNLSYTIPSF